jgi:transposase-like protein
MQEPKTLREAIVLFSDADNCLNYMVARRWPDGVFCPTCGRTDARFLKNQRRWQCKSVHAKRQFTLKTGTVMEESPIPLEKWLPAMWLLSNCKNGISSYELARDLGITQKSAWFMLHRIRLAMKSGSFFKLGSKGGPVEMDETFIGGKVKNMHKAKIKKQFHGVGTRGGHGKAVVFGILERGGQVRAMSVADRRKHSIDPVVAANVEEGSHIITDEADVYKHLTTSYYHEVINHVEGYVREHVHTNGIENFWSLLKRGLNGTYVNVEPFHLDAYVGEQVFRFNNRATKDNPLNDADRFALAVSQVQGKRLTYAELTGKVTGSVN